MTQLGSEFAQKYIHQLGFLDSQFKPENFFIRSTDYRRTIETAQCVIMGMYPSVSLSQFRQEKGNDESAQPSLPNPFYFLISSDDKIIIHILHRKLENMYPRSNHLVCPRLHILHQQIQQSDEWKKAEQEVEPLKQRIINEVYHNSGVPLPPKNDFWVGLHNTALILQKHNFTLPPTLVDNIGLIKKNRFFLFYFI